MTGQISKKEEESVKYVIRDSKDTPGPGYYDVDYDPHVVTDGPSWSQAERVLNLEEGGSGKSPGPLAYDDQHPGNIGKGLAKSFPKAKRFQHDDWEDNHKSEGPGFYTVTKKIRDITSQYGTVPQAERNTIATNLMLDTPGPKYNTRPGWRKGTKNSTMSKAPRWATPEEEESPGPIYYPKRHEIGAAATSKGLKFATAYRFKDWEGPGGPGPSTSNSSIVGKGKASAPSFSFGVKPKSWSPWFNSHSPGQKYNPKDDYVRKKAPGFSFGPPQDNINKSGDGVSSRSNKGTTDCTNITNNTENGEKKWHPRKKIPKAQQMKDQLAEQLLQARRSAGNTALYGLESPGPAHYGNIYKLFDNQPKPKAAPLASRPKKREECCNSPGPAAYSPDKYKVKEGPTPKHGTFSKAPRQTVELNKDSPGPVYSNEKWTKKTPIRHGVATQTTNYRTKAEAYAKARMEAKAKQNLKYQLAKLQEDYPSPEDEYLQQRQDLNDDLPTRKDKFLVNVWY